jgi:hypothetical protein
MIYYSKKVQAAQQGAILLNNDARLRNAVLRNGTMGGPMKNNSGNAFFKIYSPFKTKFSF